MLAALGVNDFELVAGSGGVFEIEIDGDLKFSKKAFPGPGNIFPAVEEPSFEGFQALPVCPSPQRSALPHS